MSGVLLCQAACVQTTSLSRPQQYEAKHNFKAGDVVELLAADGLRKYMMIRSITDLAFEWTVDGSNVIVPFTAVQNITINRHGAAVTAGVVADNTKELVEALPDIIVGIIYLAPGVLQVLASWNRH